MQNRKNTHHTSEDTQASEKSSGGFAFGFFKTISAVSAGAASFTYTAAELQKLKLPLEAGPWATAFSTAIVVMAGYEIAKRKTKKAAIIAATFAASFGAHEAVKSLVVSSAKDNKEVHKQYKTVAQDTASYDMNNDAAETVPTMSPTTP